MAGVANMQAPQMQQIQGGYPWSTNFQNAQNQRLDNTRPQGMLDVWSWQHEKIIEELTEAKIMLQNYQKV